MTEVPKSDPSAEQAAAPGPTLVKDETEKATAGASEEKQDKPADKPAATVTETVTNAASAATTAVKDNVFSMFGGGPKKEKKEEEEDATAEPSGSSKAKADVCDINPFVFGLVWMII